MWFGVACTVIVRCQVILHHVGTLRLIYPLVNLGTFSLCALLMLWCIFVNMFLYVCVFNDLDYITRNEIDTLEDHLQAKNFREHLLK